MTSFFFFFFSHTIFISVALTHETHERGWVGSRKRQKCYLMVFGVFMVFLGGCLGVWKLGEFRRSRRGLDGPFSVWLSMCLSGD